MQNNLTTLTNLHNSLGQSIGTIEVQAQTGFTSTAQALLKLQQDVVGAIAADSSSVTYKLEAMSVANANLMEAYAKRRERIEKTTVQANNALEVEKDYGAKNIPANLCRLAGRIEERGEVRRVAASIMNKMQVAQMNRRGSEGTEKISILTPSMTDQLPSMSSLNYPEDEAGVLLDQVPYITGESSFNFSVDNAVKTLGDKEARGVMSAWLRSADASETIAKDISKRSVPVVEEESAGVSAEEGQEVLSIYGEYQKEVVDNLSKEALTELGNSGDLKILRKIATESGLNLKMLYEQLEAKASNNRMRASILGFMVDREANYLESAMSVKKGNN
jgi:hypothetical protein